MVATATAARTTKRARRNVTRIENCRDSVSELIRNSYAAFAQLYSAGDFDKYTWLFTQLERAERLADSMPEEKLHELLSSLYKRYRMMKKGEGVIA